MEGSPYVHAHLTPDARPAVAHRRARVGIAIAAALLVAGCGGEGSDTKVTYDREEAQASFVKTCGGCHTLDDAGTNGSFGPDLGDAPREADLVAAQIDRGGGGMPPELLKGKDRDAVAQYVADASNGE